MLACARIGAVHSVVFGGFSPDRSPAASRTASRSVVITADEGLRGGSRSRSRPTSTRRDRKVDGVDQACWSSAAPAARSTWSRAATSGTTTRRRPCRATARREQMDAEDPLFILYTSGSTGKPKGVLHTTGGYLVYAAMTHQLRLRLPRRRHLLVHRRRRLGHRPQLHRLRPARQRRDHADVRGRADLSATSRFWEVVDKHEVNIFYTAPTAIRALMRAGDEPVKKTSRKSLRLLGTVGEPINPEAWLWYHRVVGDEPLPDRRHLVADRDRRHPDHAAARRDAAEAGLGDAARSSASSRRSSTPTARCSRAPASGNLCIADSLAGPDAHRLWRPRALRARPTSRPIQGKYFTGDGCRRDEDGYYWITGRVDDVLNVSGHRLGTAEVESALVAHAKVSPRRRWSAIRTTSRARASTPT